MTDEELRNRFDALRIQGTKTNKKRTEADLKARFDYLQSQGTQQNTQSTQPVVTQPVVEPAPQVVTQSAQPVQQPIRTHGQVAQQGLQQAQEKFHATETKGTPMTDKLNSGASLTPEEVIQLAREQGRISDNEAKYRLDLEKAKKQPYVNNSFFNQDTSKYNTSTTTSESKYSTTNSASNKATKEIIKNNQIDKNNPVYKVEEKYGIEDAKETLKGTQINKDNQNASVYVKAREDLKEAQENGNTRDIIKNQNIINAYRSKYESSYDKSWGDKLKQYDLKSIKQHMDWAITDVNKAYENYISSSGDMRQRYYNDLIAAQKDYNRYKEIYDNIVTWDEIINDNPVVDFGKGVGVGATGAVAKGMTYAHLAEDTIADFLGSPRNPANISAKSLLNYNNSNYETEKYSGRIERETGDTDVTGEYQNMSPQQAIDKLRTLYMNNPDYNQLRNLYLQISTHTYKGTEEDLAKELDEISRVMYQGWKDTHTQAGFDWEEAQQEHNERAYHDDNFTKAMVNSGITVGEMVPSMAAGLVGEPASMATLFASAAGGAADQAINEGATINQGTLYGGLSGTTEVLTERVGGDNLNRALGIKGQSLLSKVFGKSVKNLHIDSKAAKVALNFLFDVAGEMTEEGISAAVDPLLKTIAYDPNAMPDNVGDYFKDIFEAAVEAIPSTVIMSGIGAGGKVVRVTQAESSIIKQINESDISQAQKNKLIAEVKKASQDVKLGLTEESGSYEQDIKNNMKSNNNNQIARDVEALNMQPAQNNSQTASQNISIADKVTELNKQGYNIPKTTADILQTIQNQRGVTINFDPNVKGNGTYNEATRTITLNPNSKRAIEFTTVHELAHDLKAGNMEDYTSLQNTVLDYARKNPGFLNAIESLDKTYKDEIGKGNYNISDEATNDILAEAIGNQEFLNSLAQEKPNLFERIYNWFKNVLFDGNKSGLTLDQRRTLNKMQQGFRNAYQKAFNGTQQNGVQNSLSENNQHILDRLEDDAGDDLSFSQQTLWDRVSQEMEGKSSQELVEMAKQYGLELTEEDFEDGDGYADLSNAIEEQVTSQLKEQGYELFEDEYFAEKPIRQGYDDLIDWLDENNIDYETSRSSMSGIVPSIYIKNADGDTVMRIANHHNHNTNDYNSDSTYTYKDYTQWQDKILPDIQDRLGLPKSNTQYSLSEAEADDRTLAATHNLTEELFQNSAYEKTEPDYGQTHAKQGITNFDTRTVSEGTKDTQNRMKKLNDDLDLTWRTRDLLYDRRDELEKQYNDTINSEDYKNAFEQVKAFDNAEDAMNSEAYKKLVEAQRIKDSIKDLQDEIDIATADMRRMQEEINNLENEDRTPEKAIKQAKKIFGTTTDFKEAGYILQDGKMLDFSGRKQGNTTSGRRALDHRQINEVGYDMDEFIGLGNIRLQPEGNGFQLMVEPTDQQYKMLEKFINQANGNIYIDIYKDGKMANPDSTEYTKNTPTSKIIDDLRQYFKNGKFPTKSQYSNFLYSISDEANENGGFREANPVVTTVNSDAVQELAKKYDMSYYFIEANIGKTPKYAKSFLESQLLNGYMKEHNLTDSLATRDSQEYKDFLDEVSNNLFEKNQYDQDEVMDEAIFNSGTTDDYSVGAYMTTDGQLLDFDDGGGYRDDHRTLDVFDMDMQDFMDYGAIRMMPESNGFEIAIEPTQAQYERLADYIDEYVKNNAREDDTILVDIDTEGSGYISKDYSLRTPTSKIINDIKTYFETGEYPDTQYMYSKNSGNNTWQQFLDNTYGKWNTGTRTNFEKLPSNEELQQAERDSVANEPIAMYSLSEEQQNEVNDYISKLNNDTTIDDNFKDQILTRFDNLTDYKQFENIKQEVQDYKDKAYKGVKSLVDVANMSEDNVRQRPMEYTQRKDKNTANQRKFFENAESSSIIADETKNRYNATTYEVKGNLNTLEKVRQRLDERGNDMIEEWKHKSKNFTDTDVALGAILIERYQQQGDWNSAARAVEKLADMGTEAGRAVQMYSIFQRLSPETMAIYQQKALDKAFEEMKQRKTGKWVEANQEKFKLTAEDTQFIYEQVEKASQAIDEETKQRELSKIENRINDKLPPEDGQAIKALRRIAMLFNPKTQVRNIVGNTLIMPVNDIADVIGAGIDRIVARKTGTRTTGLPNPITKAKGFAKGIKSAVTDYKTGTRTTGSGSKYEFDIGAKPFNENTDSKVKNAINNKLNGINNLLSAVMSGGDRPFYEAAYKNSLESQMKANKVKEPTQDMIDIAVNEALQRTWNDNNEYTKFVLGLRKAFNNKYMSIHGFGFGDLILPFAKTPANLTKAMVEYSPAGFIGAALNYADMSRAISRGEMTPQQQKKFVSSMSKAIAGTLLYAFAGTLVKAGKITGSADDDKDVRNFEQNVLGIQPYSVRLGDKTYTYSWANPINAPLAIMADTYKMSKENASLYDTLFNAVKVAGNVLLDNSFLQGISDIFTHQEGIVAGIIESIVSMPESMIPTFLSQIASLGDDKQRQTYEYKNKGQSVINRVKNKIPGARQTLEPKVNTFGEEIENQNNAFNAFLNPANVREATTTEAQREIYSLYEATGDKTIFPMQAPNSVVKNGETQNLTNKEKVRYQKGSGQYATEVYEPLFKSEYYDSISNDKKVELLTRVSQDANKMGKTEVGVWTEDTFKVDERYNELEDMGIPLADYYIAWSAQKDVVSDKNANGKTIPLSGSINKKEAIDNAIDDLNQKQMEYLYGIFDISKKVY